MPRPRLFRTAGLVGIALGALALVVPSAGAEDRTTRTGVLEVLHEDHLEPDASVHRYRLLGSDGSRTELLFDDRGPEGLGARSVRVTGEHVRPGVLRVGRTAAVEEAGGSSASAGTAAAASVSTKKVAVVLYDFRNSGARQLTPAEVQEEVFGTTTPSVRGFLAETSFGQLGIQGLNGSTGDVFGWVQIEALTTDACDYAAWGQQARVLAAAQGFQDSAYDQVVHVMPKSTCRFGGVAYMPGKYSWTVLRDVADPAVVRHGLRSVTAHEYGHNLGIHHAGSYTCTGADGRPVQISGSCTLSEYGDPFSVLGMSPNERQFHGYQKGRVSWITTARTQTLTASGTYRMGSVSTGTGEPQVLRILRPKTQGQGGDYYYFELRQPTAGFDDFLAGDPVVTGVTVRIAPDYGTNAVSRLLDTTPGSDSTPADRSKGEGGDFDDAALQPGATFTDGGISVTVTSVAGGIADVRVVLPTTRTRGGK